MSQVPETTPEARNTALSSELPLNDNVESMGENLDLKVAEVIGDSIASEPASTVQAASGSTAAVAMEQRRNDLLASKPPKKTMERDIQAVIDKKLSDLYSEQRLYSRNPVKYSEKFVEVVSKIRELRKILQNLAIYTYEQIKSLWLKIVHNIV